MKKISVIIPCYNVEKYIDRCFKSLEEQTIGIDELEIIAVDDLSTDGTRGRIEAFEERYPESLLFIPLEEHVMQGAARNIALTYASGEYVVFLDADDWLLPMALEHIYEKAVKSNADIVGYYSRTAREYSENDTDYETGRRSSLLKIDGTEDLIKLLFTGLTMRGCWDKAYKKSFIDNNGFRYAEGVFDEESLFTIPAFLSARKYYILNEELHRYFENTESTVFNLAHRMEHRDDNAKTWFELYGVLKEKGYLNREPEVTEALFIQNYFNRSFLINIPRGLKYDPRTVKDMQYTVKTFFPDYEDNPILMQMRSLEYTKRLMAFDTEAESMDVFERTVGEFAANVGNEL
jgi:glycosyltransferase involved in cell wall biosynthesis